MEEKKEWVSNPEHYGGKNNQYESIKVIEAWGLDFCLGNVVKYISRAGKKEADKTIQDLEKAKWYLERRIEQLKKEPCPCNGTGFIELDFGRPIPCPDH